MKDTVTDIYYFNISDKEELVTKIIPSGWPGKYWVLFEDPIFGPEFKGVFSKKEIFNKFSIEIPEHKSLRLITKENPNDADLGSLIRKFSNL